MRPSSVGAALAVLVLFKVPSVFAEPIAEWGGPWIVTPGLRSVSDAGDTELKRAFGENAQRDEQILNVGSVAFEALPGTQAWAKVYGESHAGSCLFSCNQIFANPAIDFERPFRLEGSPSGEWEVALTGLLIGLFDINLELGLIGGDFGDFNPQAILDAVVWISLLSDPATRFLQVSFRHENQSIVFDSSVDKKVLRNGIYLVHGSLGIKTQVHEVGNEAASGTVIGDFFNGDAGLRVGVDVAPRVTEQSIIISSVYLSILHRSPTDKEVISALAYLQAGGTPQGLRGRLLAKFVPVL